VHVDRSGWICGAVVAVSSGTPTIDEMATRRPGRASGSVLRVRA
jgi:hypothetical protein